MMVDLWSKNGGSEKNLLIYEKSYKVQENGGHSKK
jgi:hypothetical protein